MNLLTSSLSNSTKTFCLVTFTILLVAGCKPKDHVETSEDQMIDTVSAQQQKTEQLHLPETSSEFIQYNGAVDDDIRNTLEIFSPLEEVLALAKEDISIKDGIYSKHISNEKAVIPNEDSTLFLQQETKAYNAILAYEQMMSKGPSLKGTCPTLTQLTRNTLDGDSSRSILPKAGSSKFFSQGDFFFIGGAPFIGKLEPTDNATFTDSEGKPETRFATDIPENLNYLLNSIYHNKNLPTEVKLGPPLRSYYGWSREVRGIGSLIHQFINRVPVFFLTEEGVVPASIISVTVKLVPENLGCISDQPAIELACSKSINAKDVLGIYIPYGASSPTKFTITRNESRLWTADLNGDGVDDLACVLGSYLGIASGAAIAESLWFINIDGQWQIVDSGRNLDCT